MSDQPRDEHDTIELDLVAYLDGELDAATVADIDSRLATDPHFRQQLDDLKRSWEMLDLLSRPEISDDFTGTTLEMAVVESKQTAESQERQTSRWIWTTRLLAAGCCAASLFAGFLLVTNTLQRPDRELLSDLPLIENIDYYGYGDDPAFIERLVESGAFANGVDVDAEESNTTATPLPFATDDESLDDRRTRLQKMTPDEKERVRHKQQRWASMTNDEQQHVRAFHVALMTGEEAAELQRTLVAYHEWLKTLSTADRYSVLQLDDDARLERIHAIQQEHESKHVDAVVQERMSPEDARRVLQWLQRLIVSREESIVQAMPRTQRAKFDDTRNDSERRRMLMMALRQRPALLTPNDEELAQLKKRLSPSGQKFIDRAIETQEFSDVVRNWLRRTTEMQMQLRGGRRGEVSDAELARFFRTLPPVEQRRLRMQSTDAMWNSVRMRYWMDKRRVDGPRPFNDRPGGGRGPGKTPPL